MKTDDAYTCKKYDILDEEYCAWKRTVRITGTGRTNCDTFYTVMGLEKIDFMYYTKRFSILALIGYCFGDGVYMLLFALTLFIWEKHGF